VAVILSLGGSFHKVWIIGFWVLDLVVGEHRVQNVGGKLAPVVKKLIALDQCLK